jgi:hypothetical protein
MLNDCLFANLFPVKDWEVEMNWSVYAVYPLSLLQIFGAISN